MDLTGQAMAVSRGRYQMYAEMTRGSGAPIVLMHGFPDNTHLYDRLRPYLTRGEPVVRFDFLGWGRSDKPAGYPYTAANQVGDVDAVVDAVAGHVGADQVVLVAHGWCCSTRTTTGHPACAGRRPSRCTRHRWYAPQPGP